MNKRHYEHTLPNIRGSLSNTYLTTHHIKVIRGCSGNIQEVTTDYLSGKLTDSGVGCSSHEHHHECHGHGHKE